MTEEEIRSGGMISEVQDFPKAQVKRNRKVENDSKVTISNKKKKTLIRIIASLLFQKVLRSQTQSNLGRNPGKERICSERIRCPCHHHSNTSNTLSNTTELSLHSTHIQEWMQEAPPISYKGLRHQRVLIATGHLGTNSIKIPPNDNYTEKERHKKKSMKYLL